MKNDKGKGKDDNYFIMEHLDYEDDYDDDFVDPYITSVGSWLPGMLTVLFFVGVVILFLGYGVWWIAAEYGAN